MDDIVKEALLKWPHVPACYGWLGLDARGSWYMRDEQTQALGTFAQSKGSRLQHDKLLAFIARNYEADSFGQWFFQNGPQRVYVELEATPFIWRVAADFSVVAHTGLAAQALTCLLDEAGHVYLNTDIGFGLVHTLDVGLVADALEQGLWLAPEEVRASTLGSRFGYVQSPAPGSFRPGSV